MLSGSTVATGEEQRLSAGFRQLVRRGHGGGVSPAMRTKDRQSWVARPMRPVPGSRRRGNGGRFHRVKGPGLEQLENDTRERLMALSPSRHWDQILHRLCKARDNLID
jgi:hypothetical protein